MNLGHHLASSRKEQKPHLAKGGQRLDPESPLSQPEAPSGQPEGPGLSSVGHGHPGARPGSVGASCTGCGGGGALRSATECSIPSCLLPHSTGGHCSLLMASRDFPEASLPAASCFPGARQGAVVGRELCHHPRLSVKLNGQMRGRHAHGG